MIAMSGNYQRVPVDLGKWRPESEVDDPADMFTGELEEMYVDNGSVMIIIAHPDGDTVMDIQIPIQARNSWNEFVESLPMWD